jgi:hypothetical protein
MIRDHLPHALRAHSRRLAAGLAVGVAIAAVSGATVIQSGSGQSASPAAVTAVPGGINFGGGYEQTFDAMTGPEQSSVIAAVAATGASWIRIDIPFSGEELSPGNFNWYTQAEVTDAVAHGLSVDALVSYSPSWATNADGTPNIADYTSFVAAAVAHYAPLGVHTWEIWNEPNLGQNWGGSADPSGYADMLKSVFPVIKRLEPAATVLTGGLAPAPDASSGATMEPLTYLRKMYAAGAHGYFDAVADHPYSYPGSPTGTQSWNPFTYLPLMHALMVANGDGSKEIWLTEYGAPTDSSGVTPAVQAEMISQAFTVADGWSWIGALMVFDWQDSSADGDFGLLTSSGQAKPALRAFDAAAGRT